MFTVAQSGMCSARGAEVETLSSVAGDLGEPAVPTSASAAGPASTGHRGAGIPWHAIHAGKNGVTQLRGTGDLTTCKEEQKRHLFSGWLGCVSSRSS